MAKTSPLSAIQQLDARIEDQLTHFMPMEDEEEAAPPEKKWGKAKWAAGVAGSAAATTAIGRPDLVKKGAKKVADAGLMKGSGLLRKGAAGLSGMRKKLHGLEAAVDAQLRQFGMDPDDYVGARTSRKKKKRVVAGGVLAAGAVAGGVAAAGKGAMVKRGAMKAGAAMANKTGDAMLAGVKAAEKRGFKKTGKVLGKGAGKAWKGASKLMLHRVDVVARGLVQFGVR